MVVSSHVNSQIPICVPRLQFDLSVNVGLASWLQCYSGTVGKLRFDF